MPYVPGSLDDTGVSPGAQSLAANTPQGQASALGDQDPKLQEAYQLMALAQMHRLGRVSGAPPRNQGGPGKPPPGKSNLTVVPSKTGSKK